MIVAHYRFTRGSPIEVPLEFKADASEKLADVTVEAWLRYSGFRPKDVTPDMGLSGEFSVEERGENAGWLLVIPSAESAGLDLGYHVTDLRVTTDDGIGRTSDRVALIEIVEPVTGGGA
jgi:hypothetical protein